MKLTWCGEGEDVKIAGAFNDWAPAETIKQEDNSRVYQQDVQPGKYTYKWVIDGEWLVDTTQPSDTDESGNVNNVEVVVEENEPNKVDLPEQIYLTIHSAKNLPKMDVASAGDPYVIIKYGNIQLRSPTQTKTSNPEWHFEADLKLNNVDKEITVALYDEDKYTKDDFFGDFKLNIDDIIKQETVLNQTAKLSKKGEIVYSVSILKQYNRLTDSTVSLDGSAKTANAEAFKEPRAASEEATNEEATNEEVTSEEAMSGDSDSWERVSVGDCAGIAGDIPAELADKGTLGDATTKEGFVIAEVEENNNQSKKIINIERIFSWSEEFDSKIVSGGELLEDDNYAVFYWDTQDYTLLKQGIWCKQVRDTWILRRLSSNKVETLKNADQIDECLKSVLQTKESLAELLKSTLTKKIEFEGALSRWKHDKITVEKVQEGDLKTVTLRTNDCMMSGLKNIYALSNQLSLNKLKLI